MTAKKTVKYYIPQKGVYLYAYTQNGKTEMIVLNSTDSEQVSLNQEKKLQAERKSTSLKI